jgi:hypothetical protein
MHSPSVYVPGAVAGAAGLVRANDTISTAQHEIQRPIVRVLPAPDPQRRLPRAIGVFLLVCEAFIMPRKSASTCTTRTRVVRTTRS